MCGIITDLIALTQIINISYCKRDLCEKNRNKDFNLNNNQV